MTGAPSDECLLCCKTMEDLGAPCRCFISNSHILNTHAPHIGEGTRNCETVLETTSTKTSSEKTGPGESLLAACYFSRKPCHIAKSGLLYVPSELRMKTSSWK